MVTESEYFGRIPEWDEKNPNANFSICKDISPLPVTRLEHWRDFQGFIKTLYDNEIDRGLIFRGQRRYDWKLISTLGRSKISDFSSNLEITQLMEFKKAIRDRIQNHSLLEEKLSEDEKNELWSIGQHHGLMTPLLDWTYSPYVALFFAFIEEDTIEESLMPNYYRSVYLLDSSCFKNSIKGSDIGIFEPTKDEHGRLANQDGLFTISSLDIDIETEIANSLYDLFNGRFLPSSTFRMARFACKIYIKNKDREECLQNLDRMTIHHKSLFPDLHGSVYFCNKRTASFEYNFQKTPVAGGSLMFLPKEKYKAYKKGKLYYGIEKILIKILNDSLSDDEKKEIEIIDSYTKKVFKEDPPIGNLILIPQIEFLAIEITRQFQNLKKLPIPNHSYESLMKAKIDLILSEFNLKNLGPIQVKKQLVINKIIAII